MAEEFKAASGGSVPNAVERVYQDLRALIMQGQLKPRERITELQMAERCRVSRTPVREALSRLQSERLVVAEGRSLAVADIDLSEVREVLDMRIALESFGVGKACAHMTPAILDRLDSLVDSMQALEAERRFEQLSAATAAFHWAILEPCGNRRLLDTCRSLIEHSQRFRAVTLYFSMRQRNLKEDHRILVQLIRAGNPADVETEMRAHLMRASEYVR